MRKLFLLSISVLFSVGLFAQKTVYSGSDDKLKYNVKVEQYIDEVNDRQHEYFSLEIENISNSSVTFTPIFNYTTDEGEELNSSKRDDDQSLTLAPGQKIKGNFKGERNLTLFKEFLVGKSGKKASNTVFTLNSITINY